MSGLKSKVSLRFKCTNLANKDKVSKTDAFVVLFQEFKNKNRESTKLKIGRTEMIADTLNPEFV
jgi:hypothetical protein